MNAPTPVDWAKIGRRFRDAQVHYTHHADVNLYGADFDAAVARRALGGEQIERLTYETVSGALGLVTAAEGAHLVEGHTVMARLRAERSEESEREARMEVRRVRRDAARDLVKYLREWCNERRIPARLRREGFLLAADQIDPDLARNQYGEVVRDADLTA